MEPLFLPQPKSRPEPPRGSRPICFGSFAGIGMLASSALERRGCQDILLIAALCALGSACDVLNSARPFAPVEAVRASEALSRFLNV